MVDVERLVETRYEQVSPGLFQAVLASPTELHPLATDVETGLAVDLHELITDEPSLRLAIRASSTLPLLAGPPVEMDGHRYLDAGLSAAIPFRAAIADGATHILLLRSRREGEVATPPGRAGAALATRLLGRISPAVAEGFMTRAEREGADEALLAEHDADPAKLPHVLPDARLAPDSPVPSCLERDIIATSSAAGLEADAQRRTRRSKASRPRRGGFPRRGSRTPSDAGGGRGDVARRCLAAARNGRKPLRAAAFRRWALLGLEPVTSSLSSWRSPN